jgi:hypothetical protein
MWKSRYFTLMFLLFSLLCVEAIAQKKATIKGVLKDSLGFSLEAVNVGILGTSQGTYTNKKGEYKLDVPADKEITIVFSYIGFKQERRVVTLSQGEVLELDLILLLSSSNIEEVIISDEPTRRSTLTRIDPKIVTKVPSATGNFEAILFSQAGVVSNNEMSSQYSVRGGNFDENLVYVNDIEIYRPFLVRSGQQEGLSFINPDMVSSILFSTGGFESRYGDKMSSVLDVRYREPRAFASTVSGSLQGAFVHVEDASKDYRFTQIHGFRYRTNRYILNSLDTDGDYRPAFTDYQTYLTYDINDKVEVAFLGNYSRNKYQFIPETRETDFGTINEALRLTVFFEGQEVNDFETYMGAFTTTYRPRKNVKLKFITSAFRSVERETFDIEGAYRLSELERDLGSENFGNEAFVRGVGGFINHARNELDAIVANAYHRGTWNLPEKDMELQWGLRLQHEDIIDKFKEWDYIDSAGYSVPQAPKDRIDMREVIVAQNALQTNRIMGYTQWSKVWDLDSNEISLNAGARFNYWDFNDQLLFSPRATLAFVPNWEKNYLFRFSWGYYQQPPFYREMRNLFGQLNPNIKAQTSVHYVLGVDHDFKLWNRPFKMITEVYYKDMKNLIPYEIENVRLRYYATNNAVGYARGIDLKINGEFVKGIDSWVSLGVMDTREDLLDDKYYEYYNAAGDKIIFGYTSDQTAVDSVKFEPGYIPRPTDQRVTFGLFFQDYLPKNPTYKMHLNLLFGSGMPFGPPTYERYKDTLRIPPYRRVDIGFSKQLLSENRSNAQNGIFKHFKSMWISVEIFNLLQVSNTISYLWVQDIRGMQYAIPNYLTSRQLNVRFIASF